MQNYLILDNIPDLVKRGEFLPVDSQVGENFSGSDTETLYKENLIKRSADWYYRTAPVRYTVNKNYYRTEEFNKIDWKNSIVIFGCSNVFGVGVDDYDTISSQLSRMTGYPVINMGVGGSSITFSLHNSIILRSNYPTPKAVVQLWTGYDRTVYYFKKQVKNYGAWNFEDNNYMGQWVKEKQHAMTHAIFASLTSKQMWNDTQYYEASFFNETASCIGCDTLSHTDRARDFLHFGPETLKLTAERIIKNLKL